MKLLYVHNIRMPGQEANTVNVAKMCNAFAVNGCTVTLAALPGAPPDQLAARVRAHYGLTEDFDITALPAWAARASLAAAASVTLARRVRADLIYTRAPHVAFAACQAGIPAVLELHTSPDAFSGIGRIAFARAVGHPLLRSLVVISDALAQHVRRRSPTTRIIVAHDGADALAAPSRAPEREEFVVGFVGRFYRGKGVELLADLARLCPWAMFQLVGGEAKDAIRIVGAPLPANMLCHGSLTHAAATAFIDGCDVVLAPYQRTVIVADGKTDAAAWMSPLKVFEYMAAGKPMLVSDLPVLREVLTDDETAILLPPDDPAAWAAALVSLRESPALRRRLGARAQTVFLARYPWRERARRILTALAAPGASDQRTDVVGAVSGE